MGNTWEVYAYLRDGNGSYAYEQVWGGESAIRALLAARKAKHNGAGCVRIEWR